MSTKLLFLGQQHLFIFDSGQQHLFKVNKSYVYLYGNNFI
jgi:hypothetical protein